MCRSRKGDCPKSCRYSRRSGRRERHFTSDGLLVCFSTGNAILESLSAIRQPALSCERKTGVIGGISAAIAIVGLPFRSLCASFRRDTVDAGEANGRRFVRPAGKLRGRAGEQLPVGCIGVAVGALAIQEQPFLKWPVQTEPDGGGSTGLLSRRPGRRNQARRASAGGFAAGEYWT